MQKFQDSATGQEWQFEDGVDVATLKDIPKTLTAGVQPKPVYPSAWDAAAKVWLVDMAAAKLIAFAAVDKFHSDTVMQLVGNPTQVEKDTWAMKLDTANAITNKATISAAGNAFLGAAGIATTAAQATWAAKVLASAATYAKVVGLAEGLRTLSKAAITAATDQVSLDAAQAANKTVALAAIAALPKA